MDDDDEEDDEGDWEEGAEELIDKKSTYEGPTARELESNRRLNEMLKYVDCRISWPRGYQTENKNQKDPKKLLHVFEI